MTRAEAIIAQTTELNRIKAEVNEFLSLRGVNNIQKFSQLKNVLQSISIKKAYFKGEVHKYDWEDDYIKLTLEGISYNEINYATVNNQLEFVLTSNPDERAYGGTSTDYRILIRRPEFISISNISYDGEMWTDYDSSQGLGEKGDQLKSGDGNTKDKRYRIIIPNVSIGSDSNIGTGKIQCEIVFQHYEGGISKSWVTKDTQTLIIEFSISK